MSEQFFPMTKDGLEQLKKELNELQLVKREENKERVKHARSFCDFREDSEYDAALKERIEIEERITMIENMIQNAQIISKNSNEIVELGSTVSIKEMPHGQVETYMIVGREESNPDLGKISYLSPLANELIGSKIDDLITIKTFGEEMTVKIVNIR